MADSGIKVKIKWGSKKTSKSIKIDAKTLDGALDQLLKLEEYRQHLDEVLTLFESDYAKHIRGIEAAKTHNGYFSIDKKKGRLVDPTVAKRGENAGEKLLVRLAGFAR